MHRQDGYEALLGRVVDVRRATEALAAGLSDADATVQSMPDASPAKWHLAHTSWFFETMVLRPHLPGYDLFDERFPFLFNSYYEALGPRHERGARGMLTRPSLDQVFDYRHHVNAGLERLQAGRIAPEARELIQLGLHHEQQHQELLLTDILHLFASNPLEPALRPDGRRDLGQQSAAPDGFATFEGGLAHFGHDGPAFAFDCEGPRHQRHLAPFRLARSPVTNGEWLEFIADDGYRRPELWLSDGWALCRQEGWQAPLYWREEDGAWSSMTLRGRQPLWMQAPVCHVSLYEADAYARWKGMRLPTEFEWELAASNTPVTGNFADSGILEPRPPATSSSPSAPVQLFGDVWEWTESAFARYPGFRTPPGAVGEYNGKFMSGQYVLRGGSCATPGDHVRATYRNFFPPSARWQFSGLRLADDA